MMTNFKTRIKKISRENGKIILANDYDNSVSNLESITTKNIKTLNKYICGLKFNFHLLLPLGSKELIRINKLAHTYGLQTIADIKLNDIGNTNKVTTEHLWSCGFDAVIVNPIMGLENLKKLTISAHRKKKGIISLCHMSAPEARFSYEIQVKSQNREKKLYEIFLDWALTQKVDGIICGATFPKIIKYCRTKAKNKLNIYSPGVGTQGGTVQETLDAGSDFLIVGRTILNSKNPSEMAHNLQLQTITK